MTKGKIILVGAGPGDAELLTVKAVRALESAEVILHDALVSQAVLDVANKNAQIIAVGKKGHGLSCRQDDINAQMVALALSGKNVVRLKGGDPLIFSRAAEELAAAHVAGISVEIIPGITAAQGAAAALNVPLTHRDSARRLQFVTGHDHKGALPPDIDFKALADPLATTAVYMAKKTIAQLSAKLIEHGLPKTTPAVAVMEATLPTQKIIRGTIETLPAQMEQAKLEGAVIVLIGPPII